MGIYERFKTSIKALITSAEIEAGEENGRGHSYLRVSNLTRGDLEMIEDIMSENGVYFWLSDPVKANIHRTYELWVEVETYYGGGTRYTWGIARVD